MSRIKMTTPLVEMDGDEMKGVPCVEKLENGGFKFNKQ